MISAYKTWAGVTDRHISVAVGSNSIFYICLNPGKPNWVLFECYIERDLYDKKRGKIFIHWHESSHTPVQTEGLSKDKLQEFFQNLKSYAIVLSYSKHHFHFNHEGKLIYGTNSFYQPKTWIESAYSKGCILYPSMISAPSSISSKPLYINFTYSVKTVS